MITMDRVKEARDEYPTLNDSEIRMELANRANRADECYSPSLSRYADRPARAGVCHRVPA